MIKTEVVDLSKCKFRNIEEITGKAKSENRWRIVNGYLSGIPMNQIGPESPIGKMLLGANGEDI